MFKLPLNSTEGCVYIYFWKKKYYWLWEDAQNKKKMHVRTLSLECKKNKIIRKWNFWFSCKNQATTKLPRGLSSFCSFQGQYPLDWQVSLGIISPLWQKARQKGNFELLFSKVLQEQLLSCEVIAENVLCFSPQAEKSKYSPACYCHVRTNNV